MSGSMDFRNGRSDDDMDVDSRVFEVESVSGHRFESDDGKFAPKVDRDLDLLSAFDDYVANEKHGALSFVFELGDMVWAKVKSHPWWPGHILSEAFASSSVRRTRREGSVLVAFFGDSSYGWFDPSELIPFNRYFTEKYQQTTSRTFVKAVEEAIDEASRRSSLGLACKCRNPYNFRPTNVKGYFAVDLPDCEPNGVYSADQINKARDRFKPGETLLFIKQLALSLTGVEQKSIDFIENRATVITYRKAIFEEYDETYEQAFKMQSARPAQDPVHLKDRGSRKPARAPFSGPLVIAGTLAGGKSAKKPMKVKDHSKKDKYLLKQRDEPNEISQQQPSSSPTQAGEFVMQKRAKNENHEFVVGDLTGSRVNASSGFGDTKPSHDMVETKERMESDVPGVIDSTSPSLQQKDYDTIDSSLGMSTNGRLKKVKVLKWSSRDLSSEDPETVERKKKRKRKELTSETNSDHPRKHMASEKSGYFERKSSLSSLAPGDDSQMNQQKLPDVEISQILRDLHALALDPFHGVERKSPNIIRHFFLRFRSLVYQKSLLPNSLSESEPVEVRSKPGKHLLRPDDPTIAGRKSMPSERQEETAARRLKKINQIKSLAAEKKGNQKTAEATRIDVKVQVASAPSKPVRHDSVKKTFGPNKTVYQPTMLIMKFPPDTSLPSGAELKAKFGRFGSLDQSAIRVFWKTFTCRVVFRQKADAEAAYKYAVVNKSLFGNVSVRYFVKAPDDTSMQFKDPVIIETPPPARLHQPIVQSTTVNIKSCLKKPTGDDGGKRAREARVKFALGGEETSNKNKSNKNTGSYVNGGAPSPSPLDNNSKNVHNKFIILPVSTTFSANLPVAPQFAKTPLNDTHHSQVAPPPPPPHRNDYMNNNSPDISEQMLSLLTRCNEVVNNITGLLGYAAYHAL